MERERLGITRTRDGDVLKILVFLQRLALDRNNGRPRGRAFLDALRGFYPAPSAPLVDFCLDRGPAGLPPPGTPFSCRCSLAGR